MNVAASSELDQAIRKAESRIVDRADTDMIALDVKTVCDLIGAARNMREAVSVAERAVTVAETALIDFKRIIESMGVTTGWTQ